MGLLKINALYRQAQIDVKRKPAGPFGAFVVGLAFAFGWTPCIGPILAAVPVVCVSAVDNASVLAQLGTVEFVHKPIDFDQLVQLLSRLMK